MKYLLTVSSIILATILTKNAQADDLYLFYSGSSDNLDEINISKEEVFNVFDGEFGPAADELPLEVKFDDFYVSKFPDQSFVFILNAPYNCGNLGCNVIVAKRDSDGELIMQDSKKPLKCKIYDADKLICTNGGYKPKVMAPARKKILHFYSPKS